MTQQDETDQSAATDQFVTPRPSPYLDTSEGSPQAYVAPPQPGQPRYGTAPQYGARLGADGTRSQPYAGPRHDLQPGYGQPGYGRPGHWRAGNRQFGSATRRDPALAAPWERLAASFIDWIIIYVVSVLPYGSGLLRIAREMQAIVASSPGQNSPAAEAGINSLLANPSTQHVLVYWSLTLFGLALGYYWVQHAAWGATIGKRVVGVRVVRADDQTRVGVMAAGVRAVAFLAGPAVLWLLASPLNVAGGVLWVADSGLALLDPRAQCLHDKLAGTLVLKKRWLDQQARSADRYPG
jgi:uncharacterized RDD family membrane protein YckC